MEKQVNNKFIQPDPAKMEKVPAQMMIYDGAGWLEISNQQTINDFGKITTDLSTEASKTREYVDRLDEEFKQADSEILKTIKTETAKLDESITNAKLDTKNVDQRVTEIDSQNKQKVEEIKNNLTLIDKKLDDSQAQNQQAVADLQKQAGEMKISVAEQLKNKSVEIAEAKQQAIDNANAALKSFETDVTTKFENANGQISQMVTKTDHNNLAKRVGSNTTLINQNQHAIELKADRTEVDETNTKISDLSSSLAVANDAIKAKAEKTDVDKLAGRVDKAETNLELTSQQIKLKADSSTVNDLTGSVNALKQSALTVDSDKIRGMTSEIERANQRITDTNTLTEQNANTIKTLATKTEINELTQTVSQSKSELNQTIDGIRASVTSLYDSETYKGIQKIVQNSAFLQTANGFTTQVQSTVSDELKQINLVYNSEFEPGNGQEIEGWTANHPLKRGTNMYDNYYGSTSLGMDTFSNATDQWVSAWSQMIDVNEGDHLSASVVVFYTGGEQPSGRCGIEIELFEREDVSRKTWTGNYEDIANAPRDHKKTIRVDDYTIPSGITKARLGLVIEGKGDVMFAHPMLVKGTRAGIYQPSVVNKLSKLTQTLDGLKSEVHDGSINSVIGQTARMIALQISGDKNKVISQINASTEGIMIDGKHIMINGNTRIQGTLMVNDVVMKSQNNAVKFSPESLDMIGANSMLKLQSDSIQLRATSNDPRQQWGIGLSKNGLALTVPVKKPAAVTNNPEDYQREIQGYINGGGWDYTKAEAVGSGASGIEIGLMAQQVWGDPYGGDYIAIGQYVPTNSQKTSRAFTPAISYSETGVGWAPRDIHMYKPTTFHSEVHMKVPSTGYGIRTAWVSWSDWNNEKYPCFVNDTSNWGGIAFPSNGCVVMFNSVGKRFNIYTETKDNKYNGYGGN